MPEATDTPLGAPAIFPAGEEVRISKKSHVIDREREHENLSKEERVPIEQEVTGMKGTVCGMPYASKAKDGETCVPIDLGDGTIVAVPSNRLERTSRMPRQEDQAMQRGGSSPVSQETMDFWKKHFEQEEENKRLKRENEELRRANDA